MGPALGLRSSSICWGMKAQSATGAMGPWMLTTFDIRHLSPPSAEEKLARRAAGYKIWKRSGGGNGCVRIRLGAAWMRGGAPGSIHGNRGPGSAPANPHQFGFGTAGRNQFKMHAAEAEAPPGRAKVDFTSISVVGVQIADKNIQLELVVFNTAVD